jgi:ADP-ribose diphosphatase
MNSRRSTGEVLWRDAWLSVRKDGDGDAYLVSGCGEEVVIVALEADGSILFVEEPAPAFDETALGLPTGAVEAAESPLEAAQRELREETGFGAREMRVLASVRPWPKYLRMTSHVVLAEDLYAAPLEGDERHPIILRRMSPQAADAAVAAGELSDARVIVALALQAATERQVR